MCDTDTHRQSETVTGEESGDGSREREDPGARDQSVQRCRGQQQQGVRGEELHGREAHPQTPGHPHPAGPWTPFLWTPTEAVAKREFGILIEGECISLSCQVTFCFSSSCMLRWWYQIERFDTFLEFSSHFVKSLCLCVCVGGWVGACVRVCACVFQLFCMSFQMSTKTDTFNKLYLFILVISLLRAEAARALRFANSALELLNW